MSAVLDASALLARLLREPGQDVVNAALADDAVMSSVNFAEVVTRLVRGGLSASDTERAVARLPVTIHPFDEAMAFRAGAMVAVTQRFGLSLGDRACLALALREKLPVLTGDRAWAQAGPLVGVTIKLIR